MKPKLSIIVPVYNVEKHLVRSIESMRKQTLQNIEIILVNDGSVDRSLDICVKYQEKDNRIKIIDKPNGGVSSARNAGLEVAEGEYIGFVDPDDWVESNMFESLYIQAKSADADVCICNYVIEHSGKSTPNLLNINKSFIRDKEIVTNVVAQVLAGSSLNSGSQPTMGSIWRLIVKKELIDKHNLKFNEKIHLMEDLVFFVELFLCSKCVGINKGTYYHYYIYSDSAATSYRPDMLDIHKNIFRILEKMLKEKGVYQLVEQRMHFRYVNICIEAISNILHKENKESVNKKLTGIQEIVNDERLKDILKTVDTKGYTFRKRLVLNLLSNNNVLLLYLYYSFLLRIKNKKAKRFNK